MVGQRPMVKSEPSRSQIPERPGDSDKDNDQSQCVEVKHGPVFIGARKLFGTHSSHGNEHDRDQHHKHVLYRIKAKYFLADQIKVNFGAHEIQHQPDEQLGVGCNEGKKIQLAIVLAALLPLGICRENCCY